MRFPACLIMKGGEDPMLKIRSLWHKARANWRQILPIALLAVILGGYVLGVVSTAMDPRIEGVSYFPWDALRSLFSTAGQKVLTLLAGAGLLIWLFVTMRNARYAGLQKDDRNFYMSDKGVYGTASFMDNARMMRCLDVRAESDCQNAEGDIVGIKDGMVLSLPRRSMLNRNVSVYGSSGSMKSRAVIRNQIIGAARRGESLIITGATRSPLKRRRAGRYSRPGELVFQGVE